MPQWSTDGSTFGGADTGVATKAVQAVNPASRPGGTDLGPLLLQPVQPQPSQTGGDGFTPVVYRNGTGGVEAWNIYHHIGTLNQPRVVCTDLITATPCTGGPWPRPLNTAAGPLGSGNTGDIGTLLLPQYAQDPSLPGLLFYPGVTAGSVGVGCLDMAARANCGYTPLQNLGGSPSAVNGIGGVVATGGRIYGASTTGQILCMVIATRAACPAQPFAAVAGPSHDVPNGGEIETALQIEGGKVFVLSDPQSATVTGPPVLGCFDPATSAACTGWAAPKPAGPNGVQAWSVYRKSDTGGICATAFQGAPQTTCYTVAGATTGGPGWTSVLAGHPGALIFSPKTVAGPDGHVRDYFPVWGSGLNGATVCWDWTAGALCSGFPQPAGHGVTRDYGYDYDATTRCLIGLGDAGVLFSEDPITGASPCVHSGAAVGLTPNAFYCDGRTNHAASYRDARLEGIDPAHVNLAASSVTVTDGATVLSTPGFAPDGTVDLSGISYAAHPSVTVTESLVLLSTSDFGGGNQPRLVVSFTGDAPQMCFRTAVGTACTTSGVSNTATGTDVTGALSSNRVDVAVTPGAACQPVVTVNKEICDSNQASRCGPGGTGPWVKNSTPGLLGVLGIASWRITVSNAGPVDVSAATLIDPAEHACVAAAGTFTVPVGTSRQFYCSTLILGLPVVNTVRVSFVAANSPPGTPASVSAPSSAKACNLLCILL
jgi:hypothetical protein